MVDVIHSYIITISNKVCDIFYLLSQIAKSCQQILRIISQLVANHAFCHIQYCLRIKKYSYNTTLTAINTITSTTMAFYSKDKVTHIYVN